MSAIQLYFFWCFFLFLSIVLILNSFILQNFKFPYLLSFPHFHPQTFYTLHYPICSYDFLTLIIHFSNTHAHANSFILCTSTLETLYLFTSNLPHLFILSEPNYLILASMWLYICWALLENVCMFYICRLTLMHKKQVYCTVYPVLLFKPWIPDLNKRLKPMSIDSTYFDSFDISFFECRIQYMYSVHVTSL